MKSIKSFIYLFPLVCLIASCTKGGLGGDNTLVIYPFHHSKPIPNTIVYIKYGTKDFPGQDVSAYDDHQVAIYHNAGDNPSVVFTGLKKGKYFLWGVGNDTTLQKPFVSGGIPFEITKKSGETDTELPITEPRL